MSYKSFELHKKYFFAAILLFLIEVCIAVFVRDKIVRPYVGDFLVVMLLYTFLKSFLKISVEKAVLSVLFFCYFIETLQHLNLTRLPGMKQKIVLVVLGSHFEWTDIMIYTCSGITILAIEKYRSTSEKTPERQGRSS